MSVQPNILLSVGTRPEVIKMAPIYLELKQRGMKPMLLHTGQHDEMAQSLYDLFGIVPDFTIELDRKTATKAGEKNCDLSLLSSALLEKISGVMLKANPSIVMVHGDTSSALMAALAAFYQKRKVAHVEAGLRSHCDEHPFPEEKNRALVAKLSHWHFAPTERAHANLTAEGIAEEHIHVVGNTIVQATQMGAARLDELRKTQHNSAAPDLVDTLSAKMEGKRIVLVTVHRRENHDGGIQSIAKAVVKLMQEHDDILVVWPVHPNPKVVAAVNAELGNVSPAIAERLHVTQPLAYPLLLWVLKNAWIVLTDSGGIQEEAVALHTPVLVLRETTERPEVIEVGAGLLVGTKTEEIISTFNALDTDRPRYEAMRTAPNPFGNEMVANTICNILLH